MVNSILGSWMSVTVVASRPDDEFWKTCIFPTLHEQPHESQITSQFQTSHLSKEMERAWVLLCLSPLVTFRRPSCRFRIWFRGTVRWVKIAAKTEGLNLVSNNKIVERETQLLQVIL